MPSRRSSRKVAKKTSIQAIPSELPSVTPAGIIASKPPPQVGASCRHRCVDKAICMHSCCQESLHLSNPPKCDELIYNNDLVVCLFYFLSVNDLRRLRYVSRDWRTLIQGSENYRKASFLEAEESGDPQFLASIKEEYLKFDRSLHSVNIQHMRHIPARQVRINPLLFEIDPDFSLAYLKQNHSQLVTDVLDYSIHGVDLCTRLALTFRPTNNEHLHAESSCMDMFLTRPPLKEVLVSAAQYTMPRDVVCQDNDLYVLISNDDEGLRYRDLFRHFNLLGEEEGAQLVVTKLPLTRIVIPRCEALNADGMPELLDDEEE